MTKRMMTPEKLATKSIEWLKKYRDTWTKQIHVVNNIILNKIRENVQGT